MPNCKPCRKCPCWRSCDEHPPYKSPHPEDPAVHRLRFAAAKPCTQRPGSLPREAHQDRGGLHARWHRRRCGPHPGAVHGRATGPKHGGRKPRRGQRQPGNRVRAARHARWVHDLLYLHRPCGEPVAVQGNQVRPGQGLQPHRPSTERAQHAGGARQLAIQHRERTGDLRQGQPRQAGICVLGQWCIRAPVGRTLQAVDRHLHGAHPLPGHRQLDPRFDLGQCGHGLPQSAQRLAAGAKRQAQSPGRDHR